jgi:hypothetical protein
LELILIPAVNFIRHFRVRVRMTQELPFPLESELERAIAADPDWNAGVQHGEPRPGHPEGRIDLHVAEVLGNIDAWYADSPWRTDLRLIALVHDSFKHEVDRSKSRSGENHHAMRARRFAERFELGTALLDIIELHDDAYNSWQCGPRDNNWPKAERRADSLIERLGDNLDLYLAFYRCDNATGDKQPDSYRWFEERVRQSRQS